MAGLEISENQSDKYKTVTNYKWWKNKSNRKGLPKGHPFIDREFPGALKVTEDSIEKPEDPSKNMTAEELKEYFNKEWNK